MTQSIIKLDFGEVTFLDRIQIAEINEGVLFDTHENEQIINLARDRFKEEKYGYISHRVNSYSVNPIIYMEAASFPKLAALAIVSSNPVTRNTAQIEKRFFKDKNAFEVFETLEEAIAWIKTHL